MPALGFLVLSRFPTEIGATPAPEYAGLENRDLIYCFHRPLQGWCKSKTEAVKHEKDCGFRNGGDGSRGGRVCGAGGARDGAFVRRARVSCLRPAHGELLRGYREARWPAGDPRRRRGDAAPRGEGARDEGRRRVKDDRHSPEGRSVPLRGDALREVVERLRRGRDMGGDPPQREGTSAADAGRQLRGAGAGEGRQGRRAHPFRTGQLRGWPLRDGG